MKLKRFSNINEEEVSEDTPQVISTKNGMGFVNVEETEDKQGYNITFEFQGSVRGDEPKDEFLKKIADSMEKVMNDEFEELR